MSEAKRTKYDLAVWHHLESRDYYAFPMGGTDPWSGAVVPQVLEKTWEFVGIWPAGLAVTDIRPQDGGRVQFRFAGQQSGQRFVTAGWVLDASAARHDPRALRALDLLNNRFCEFWDEADARDPRHGPWDDLLGEAADALAAASDADEAMKAVEQTPGFKALKLQSWSVPLLVRVGEVVRLLVEFLPKGDARRAAAMLFKTLADPKARKPR